ncbi:acyl-CoA dehydrogenase family protein [Pontivivens insulae]|uniref:(2S)-methylsuccinyl-CoA dehydrogenase n=1 Tax=Pontivivens insulae TaxID=1639689 RepID=A0A2R8ADD1_9RHOB|nr:acyl-CoA dehydrogenase family protein [Pontivivens insulae]RED14166.1 (2S)-methylsuccinyl-CoA dehydrogenase [Pontivivens insulae]SPF30241.1 (2S)-methylsuccinyl-CoA dehydrogenase [Pontivivens insulae]
MKDMVPGNDTARLLADVTAAVDALATLKSDAVAALAARVAESSVDAEQYAAHGVAWVATYVEALTQMADWAQRLGSDDLFGEMEALLLQIAFGEYAAQLAGGIPMSQGEIFRISELGLETPASVANLARGNTASARARLTDLMTEREGIASYGATGLDEEFEMIRDQFRRFANDRVIPHAHEWHLKDELIPMSIIEEMSELGVFGLTIPEEHGGFGFGKTAMCVVSEELSRGYIGVGSLGTRSEIAAELILCGGTVEQKAEWLPKLASGETLPTAVFTEPNTGSDLGALKTRGIKDGDDWILRGNKTWITHGGRTDLMTVLARTVEGTDNYAGLSMFLAPKTRGTDEQPFPDATIDGGEIEVLGYRGMKEYTLALDDHRVGGEALLGGEEGKGFRQLMQTFESARIQTAARAIGVAQNALDLSLRYALDRTAFGAPLATKPRVQSKLAMMAVEIMIARQLTYFSAREKDADRRCDLEAGMAKLLGARVAWACADNGVQIHGGNGFAMEYPISRVLCDARILNIFEGAAEIQAHVVARRLLDIAAKG